MHVSDNNASYVQLASYHVCGHMCCSTQLMDLPAFLAQLRTLYSMDDAIPRAMVADGPMMWRRTTM